MRLFVAIPLPDDILEYLHSLQSKLPLYLIINKHIHLTLKFLGEVSLDLFEKIKENLSKVKFDSFSLTLNDIGFFPSEDFMRVFWLGVSPEENMIAIKKNIDFALKDFFPVEKNFKPHLTLARIKTLKDRSYFINKVKSLVIKKLSFDVNEFQLICSVLGKENKYEVLLSVLAD